MKDDVKIVPPKLSGRGLAKLINVIPNRFLWYPYIPEGEQCIIAGAGGAGKGLLGADIAARLSTGNYWPLIDERAPVMNIHWYEAEDSISKTVKPRLIAAGADLERIKIFTNRDDFQQLNRRTIIRDNIGLVVLSPFLSFVSIKNFYNELEVRAGLGELKELYDELGCSFCGIMHPNKKADLAAIERILGSVAFTNFVRSVIMLKN